MLALHEAGWGSIPGRLISKTRKVMHAISLLSIQQLGKEHGSETHVLPDGQPPTVAFIVFVQLRVAQANEKEMDAALFAIKMREGPLTLV